MMHSDWPMHRGRLIENAVLAPFTWLRVGGRADALFIPEDLADLSCFLAALRPEGFRGMDSFSVQKSPLVITALPGTFNPDSLKPVWPKFSGTCSPGRLGKQPENWEKTGFPPAETAAGAGAGAWADG